MATKKITKNRAIKKPRKKVVKKVSKGKKSLVMADNNTSFWVSNGQILNSLTALRDALSKMEKEVYLYHVKKEQNDFSDWVHSVLCDADCANDLRKARTPNSAKVIVVRHLKSYQT